MRTSSVGPWVSRPGAPLQRPPPRAPPATAARRRRPPPLHGRLARFRAFV